LSFVFLPFIGVPFLFWAIQGETRDNTDKQLKETYQSVYVMWLVRLFMMSMVGSLYAIIALVSSALMVWIYSCL
jgi:uncharacterized Tic20 family protein